MESRKIKGQLPLIILPALVCWLMPGNYPRWAFMWALAAAIYVGCKWLTWRSAGYSDAPLTRHLGYLLLWPGMDARTFLGARAEPNDGQPESHEWALALAKLLIGILLVVFVAKRGLEHVPYLAGWVAMVGLVLVLHFGVFHLLSCTWRLVGVQARPLMRWPWAAKNVSDFWGRRWNTACRDLTYEFIFRPLTSRFGPPWAIVLGFVASGLVHDLVISVPARGGYGGPTMFFVLQGLAILIERGSLGRRLGLKKNWRGRLFAAAVIVLPAPLLFHPPFLHEIVLPFVRVLGAISCTAI